MEGGGIEQDGAYRVDTRVVWLFITRSVVDSGWRHSVLAAAAAEAGSVHVQ